MIIRLSHQLCCDPLARCRWAAQSAGEGASSPEPSKTPRNGLCPYLWVSSAACPLSPSWTSSCVPARSVPTGWGSRSEPRHPPLGPHLLATPPSSGNISPTTLYAWAPSRRALKKNGDKTNPTELFFFFLIFPSGFNFTFTVVATPGGSPARPGRDGFQPELKDTQEVAIFVAQGCWLREDDNTFSQPPLRPPRARKEKKKKKKRRVCLFKLRSVDATETLTSSRQVVSTCSRSVFKKKVTLEEPPFCLSDYKLRHVSPLRAAVALCQSYFRAVDI